MIRKRRSKRTSGHDQSEDLILKKRKQEKNICWNEYHRLSSFEWKAVDQNYCTKQHSSLRWKMPPANYSSWIFGFEAPQPITALYRSIFHGNVWLPRAQEIRHRNLSRFPTLKSIGKCVKKSDIGSSVTGEIGTWRDWLNKERGDNCLKFQFPVKSSNVWRRLSSLQNFPKKGSKGLAFFLVVWQIYTFIQILMLDRFACFGLFLN